MNVISFFIIRVLYSAFGYLVFASLQKINTSLTTDISNTTYLSQPFAGFRNINVLASLSEIPDDVRKDSHELPGLVLGNGQSSGSHRHFLRSQGRQESRDKKVTVWQSTLPITVECIKQLLFY